MTFLAALISFGTAVGGLVAAFLKYRASRLKRAGEVATGTRGAKSLLPTRTKFVNRDEEIHRAFELIGSGEFVLAIEGEARIGKTAVVAELAHRLKGSDGDRGSADLSGPQLRLAERSSAAGWTRLHGARVSLDGRLSPW